MNTASRIDLFRVLNIRYVSTQMQINLCRILEYSIASSTIHLRFIFSTIRLGGIVWCDLHSSLKSDLLVCREQLPPPLMHLNIVFDYRLDALSWLFINATFLATVIAKCNLNPICERIKDTWCYRAFLRVLFLRYSLLPLQLVFVYRNAKLRFEPKCLIDILPFWAVVSVNHTKLHRFETKLSLGF